MCHVQALATGEDRIIAGQKAGQEEASLPGRKTAETERAAERIMEAVQVHRDFSHQLLEYQDRLEQYNRTSAAQKEKAAAPAPPQPHPLMVVHNTTDPDRFLLSVLRQVKSSELEEALLVLPFHYVAGLFVLLERLLTRGWDTELVARVVLFLVRLHHGPLSSAASLLAVFNGLKVAARRRVDQLRDRVGFNLAALHFLHAELEERQSVQLFADASDRVKNKRKQRHNKDKANRRAVLTL